MLRKLAPEVGRFYASRTPATAEQYRHELRGAGAFGSYAEALADARIDAVVVATTPDTHRALTLEALDAGSTYRMSSLDKPVDDADDAPTPAVGGDHAELERSPERVALHQALNGLSERDRRIVWLRFFEDKNQDEIARDVGISQVHVSRVLRATLERLREELAGLDAA